MRDIRIIWPKSSDNYRGPGVFGEGNLSLLQEFAEFSGAPLELMRLIAKENQLWSASASEAITNPAMTPENQDPQFLSSIWKKIQEEKLRNPSRKSIQEMKRIIVPLFGNNPLTSDEIAEKFPDDGYFSSDIRHVLRYPVNAYENKPDRILYTSKQVFKIIMPSMSENFIPKIPENLLIMKTIEWNNNLYTESPRTFMHLLMDCNRLEVLMLNAADGFNANGHPNIGFIAEAFGDYMRPLANNIIKHATDFYQNNGWKPRQSPRAILLNL